MGVARQYAGITGQVENCQTVVFAAYVTARGHAPFDFRLYLPKAWCRDRARRERARVPARTRFAAKPALAAAMVTAAARAGVPFVGGRRRGLRPQRQAAAGLREGRQGYVLAVPVNFAVRLPSGRKAAVAAVAATGAGRGVGDPLVRARLQGPPGLRLGVGRHRLAAALDAGPPQPRRPRLTWPSTTAMSRTAGGTLTALVTVTGKRWPAEECHQQGKGQTGLDQHQVRLWHSFHRHTVLSMCAQALLAVAAARPAPAPPQAAPSPPPPGQASPRPGATPARCPPPPTSRPPADPGMVKVSVPEARRLARLAAAPMTRSRPRSRLRLVTMETPPPGPRPLAPLPRPAQSSRPSPVNPQTAETEDAM